MAQTPMSAVYMDPIFSGHLGVCAIYSETTVEYLGWSLIKNVSYLIRQAGPNQAVATP